MTVRGYQLCMGFSGPDFSGPYDDVTSYILKDDPVTVTWGRDQGQTQGKTAAAKLTFSLDNTSRLFSPENVPEGPAWNLVNNYGGAGPDYFTVATGDLSSPAPVYVGDKFRILTAGGAFKESSLTVHTIIAIGSDYFGSTAVQFTPPAAASLAAGDRVAEYDTSSPVAAKLLPGLPVRWTDTDPDGQVRERMAGTIDDFDADPTATSRTFAATVLDSWPSSAELSTEVYAGLRTGDAIAKVLDAVGWPAGKRDLDAGATVIPWWWEEGTGAADAIQKIVDSEGPPSIAYIAGGTFTFRDRHHRLLRPASATAQATFTHLIPPAQGRRFDFEAGIAGWAATGGATLAWPAEHWEGSHSLQFRGDGATPAPGATGPRFPVTAGGAYQHGGRLWSDYDWPSGVRVSATWYDAAGSPISSTAPAATPLVMGQWAMAGGAGTAPANAATAALTVAAVGTPPAAQRFLADVPELTTGVPGAAKMLTGTITYDHGLKSIFNAADFDVPVRQPAPEGQVWHTDDTYAIGAGQTVQVVAAPSDPFFGAIVPDPKAGDFEATGTVTVTLSRTSGQSTTISLSSVAGAVVTGMTLRATGLPVTSTVKVSASDAASIAVHGRQQWQAGVPWCNQYDAAAVATRVVSMFAVNRPRLTFAVAASLDELTARAALPRQLSDRVRVRNDQIGLDADMIVEQVSHEVRGIGRKHLVILGCEVPEPVQPSNALTFGVAGKGFDQGCFGAEGISSAANVFLFNGGAGHRFNEGLFAN